ncbi:MAG: HEAT repeat domain-containing protein [Pirellulales bacterium]|nr:HEAT repeat domain-containing protein [Pirellulales bacterium]
MTVAVETYNPAHAVSRDARLPAKLGFFFALGLAVHAASSLYAHTPESPQVKSTIKRGIGFLCSDFSKDSQPGAQALAGIALLKSGVLPDHPKILAAVAKVKEMIPENNPRTATIDSIYTAGISIIFLVTLDPLKYKPEIECLLQFLYARQKKHGGWGYYNRDTGDTSMTQYGVLGSWEAQQAGYKIPADAIEGVAEWLLRTQDPGGGFGYQGKVAPEGSLTPQEEIRHSMTAAGGGCLFILADMFQMEMVPKRSENLPSALKDVRARETQEAGKSPSLKTRIGVKPLRDAQVRANEWMKKYYNIENYEFDKNNNQSHFHYGYYYLYALERYMSFRELIERHVETKWYDDGVEYIVSHQAADGSWDDQCGKTADTAFAVLFLVRSTKKAIEKAKNYGADLAFGGRGLPKPGERLENLGGVLVVKQELGPADDLMKMLDASSAADYERALEMMSELPSQQVESLFAAHGDKIRKLTRDQEPEARMAAVIALGKTRNLDNVPALIYALTDPDREVVIEARKALERISRNPVGYGPIDDYKEEQRQNAVAKWKAWYLSLRPDADVDF